MEADSVHKIVTPGDIAIYGVLCSLATKSRSAIKSSIMESSTFGVYIEHEPYVRDLVDAYMASKFKTVLDILEQYSVRLLHFARLVRTDAVVLTDKTLPRLTSFLSRP